MHAEKKDCDNVTVSSWSPELAKLNSTFSRVARRTLPTARPSQAFNLDMLRRWERAAREQTVMCNQAAGLSCCLTRVQDAMSSQLKSLHLDSSKGKSSERMMQAVDELDYLVTFNRPISQAMARTMQDLSEGVFISMANFTLARRDSYLEYLHAGVTPLLLCIRPLFIYTHFSLTSLSPRLKRRSVEVRRDVLLASLTDVKVAFTLMLPVTDLLTNRTGSPVTQHGSK